MVKNLKNKRSIDNIKFGLRTNLSNKNSLKSGLFKILTFLVDLITPNKINANLETNPKIKSFNIISLKDNIKKEPESEVDKFEYELNRLGNKLKKVFEINEKPQSKKIKKKYNQKPLKNKLKRKASEDLLKIENEFSELHKDVQAAVKHYKLKSKQEAPLLSRSSAQQPFLAHSTKDFNIYKFTVFKVFTRYTVLVK